MAAFRWTVTALEATLLGRDGSNRDVQNWTQLAAAAIISQLWPSRQNLLDRYPISQTACSSSSASHPRPTTCTALTYYKHISLNIRYFSIYFLHQASNDIQMRTVWKRLRSERNWALCASSTADEMMSDGLSACFYLESRVMRRGYRADIQKQLADSSIAAKLSQQLRAASNFERPYFISPYSRAISFPAFVYVHLCALNCRRARSSRTCSPTYMYMGARLHIYYPHILVAV